MSENIDKKLQQIIDLEIRELYDLAFFKPYLVNYIADFKPSFTSLCQIENTGITSSAKTRKPYRSFAGASRPTVPGTRR